MVADFIAEYARLIALHPDDIRVEIDSEDKLTEITLYSNQEDVGRFIGKDGKMIKAIKTVISGCKAKDGVSYQINVEAI